MVVENGIGRQCRPGRKLAPLCTWAVNDSDYQVLLICLDRWSHIPQIPSYPRNRTLARKSRTVKEERKKGKHLVRGSPEAHVTFHGPGTAGKLLPAVNTVEMIPGWKGQTLGMIREEGANTEQ
jgi:hypothetical protein